ncbi:MAG: hypothetical protein HC896_11650 [Bacteroidales bacterium]|nr:hypothetical protein [Bacteroidales bacterium]
MIKAAKIPAIELIPGDILVYSKKSAISRAIQILTRSKYNHTGTIATDGMVAEAIEKGYVKQSIKVSVKDAIQVIVKRPKHKIDVQKLDAAMWEMRNSKYEFLGIWYEIKHQLWGGWKGDRDVRKNVFCSKACAYIEYIQCNDNYAHWWCVSPDEIAEDFVSFDTYELIM